MAFTSPIYITNQSAGYTEVCAEILKGALENVVGVHVYLTTADNTATAGMILIVFLSKCIFNPAAARIVIGINVHVLFSI